MKKIMMRISALLCVALGMSLTASASLASLRSCVYGHGSHEYETHCSVPQGECSMAHWAVGDYCAPDKNGGKCVTKTRQTQVYRRYGSCQVYGIPQDKGGSGVYLQCDLNGRTVEMPNDTKDQGYCDNE